MSPEIIDLLTVLAALGALVFSILAFMRAHPNATPAELDAAVTERIVEFGSDTANIDRLELAYERQTEVFKHAFDTMASLFTLVAPLTPFKADDAARDLIKDIQTAESGAQQPIPADPPAEANG